MKTRLFVVAACLTLIVCMFSITASAAETDVTVSGRWLWNETLGEYNGGFSTTTNSAKFDNVSFTSNGVKYIGLWVAGIPNDGSTYENLKYMTSIILGDVSYSATTGWKKEAFRTIDFGDKPVTLPADFYKFLSDNAVWLDKPSPMMGVVDGIGAVFTGVIGWAGVVAATVSSNPLLLLFSIISFIGLGVIFFIRLTKK